MGGVCRRAGAPRVAAGWGARGSRSPKGQACSQGTSSPGWLWAARHGLGGRRGGRQSRTPSRTILRHWWTNSLMPCPPPGCPTCRWGSCSSCPPSSSLHCNEHLVGRGCKVSMGPPPPCPGWKRAGQGSISPRGGVPGTANESEMDLPPAGHSPGATMAEYGPGVSQEPGSPSGSPAQAPAVFPGALGPDS